MLSFDGPDPDAVPMNVTPDMLGRTVRFQVWATGPGGTTSSTSFAAGPMRRGDPTTPVLQSAPSIDLQDGTQPLSGQVLIGRTGTWDDAFRDYLYAVSWLRCLADGTNCTRVSSRSLDGPNDPVTYRMTAGDVGYTMRLEVVATAQSVPPDTTVHSAPTAVIQNGGPPVNLVAPILLVGGFGKAAAPVGDPVNPGDVLTATPGAWTVNDALVVNWLRCDRAGLICASIPGADAPAGQPARTSYIVSAADLGSAIRADVTATSFLGTATLRTPAARVGADPPNASTGTPPTTVKERATVTVRDAKITGSGNTLAVYLSLGAAGTVSVTADGAGIRIGKASRTLGKGRVAITVKISRAGRKALSKRRKVKTTLALTLKTPAGNRGSLKQRVTLRRASR